MTLTIRQILLTQLDKCVHRPSLQIESAKSMIELLSENSLEFGGCTIRELDDFLETLAVLLTEEVEFKR